MWLLLTMLGTIHILRFNHFYQLNLPIFKHLFYFNDHVHVHRTSHGTGDGGTPAT